MISMSNSKLGNVPSWSLPPRETCPGSTKLCRSACYVGGTKGYLNIYKSAGEAYSRNLDSVLLSEDWKVEVSRFLSRRKPELFRIHVSGDFFSPKYIRDWEHIAMMFPETRFLAFTRSWRIGKLRRELESLRALPNVRIFASKDAEANNTPNGWKTANMGVDEASILCPGYGPKELTCDKCKACWKSLQHVHFPIH